ncbi:MAG: carbohydrate ABC transporter permease, partial [Rhizobium oryzihabitans]
MDHIAGKRSGLTWAVNLSVIALVLLWTVPTIGLLVSSFRQADQIAATGWWKALFPSVQNSIVRAGDAASQREEAGRFVIDGNVFDT